MKIISILAILLISNSVIAQTYTKYMEQGKFFYDKKEYLTALERFDLAYEFAKTETEKEDSQNWKTKSRKEVAEFQKKLQEAYNEQIRLKGEEEKAKANESKLKDSVQKSLNDLLGEKSNTDRLRKMAIVKPLAFLAIKVSQDNKYEANFNPLSKEQADLPLIMAYQAWYFNNFYGGNPNDADVYAALSEVGDSLNKIPIKQHSDIVRDIIVSENGNEFASCSDDGTVIKYKFADINNQVFMEMPKKSDNFYFRSLSYSPDESLIAAGTHQGEILIWDLKSNKSWILYEPPRSTKKTTNKSINKLITIKTTSQLVSFGSDGCVRYWKYEDIQAGNAKNTSPKDSLLYKNTGEKFTTASLNNDENKLAVASDAGVVRIFNSNTHGMEDSCVSERGRILSLCWSKNNDLVIGFESGWIEIWDGSKLKPYRIHDSGVTDIHFDNQGNRLITSSYDGKIKIWNYDNLETEPALVKGHSDWVSCIALTKDNSRVLSGSADRSILISKINIEELKNRIRNQISENMSRENWNKYVGEDIEYSKDLQ